MIGRVFSESKFYADLDSGVSLVLRAQLFLYFFLVFIFLFALYCVNKISKFV